MSGLSFMSVSHTFSFSVAPIPSFFLITEQFPKCEDRESSYISSQYSANSISYKQMSTVYEVRVKQVFVKCTQHTRTSSHNTGGEQHGSILQTGEK